MILVDVYIPAVDASYDFMLDENVLAEEIITEVSGMISRKVKETSARRDKEFRLYSIHGETMLDLKKSLAMNYVTDGSRLLLV